MTTYPPAHFNVVEQGQMNGIRWFIAESAWHRRYPEKCGDYIPHHGYVELPDGHPYCDIPDNEFGFNDDRMNDIQVHGGITYNKDNIWGFDIGHSGDYTPWLASDNDSLPAVLFVQGHRWTLDEVRAETLDLAHQIDQSRNYHTYTI